MNLNSLTVNNTAFNVASGSALLLLFSTLISPERPSAPGLDQLLGRWEVIAYSEQGVQVDKKTASLPQAIEVYNHVRRQRAITWYGFEDDWGDRRMRAFERWVERDSVREVERVAEAIAMPYFAVFFPDSTLALYNKDTGQRIHFPESRHYSFHAPTMSIDLRPPFSYGYYPKADVQVLALTDRRMTLFLPEEAEIVELVKTEFTMP
jgi:hypothetical protein